MPLDLATVATIVVFLVAALLTNFVAYTARARAREARVLAEHQTALRHVATLVARPGGSVGGVLGGGPGDGPMPTRRQHRGDRPTTAPTQLPSSRPTAATACQHCRSVSVW